MKIVIEIVELAGGAYRACCPALPGCVAFGGSPGEVRERMAEAVRGYLGSLDTPVPEPLSLDGSPVAGEAAPSRSQKAETPSAA